MLCLVLIQQTAQAQDCDESVVVPEAGKRYATGNFDDVFALLRPCVDNSFSENARIQAYKILSMTYLAIDSLPQSSRTIGQLLALNPRFEPDFSAPPRYKALVTYVRETQEQVMQVTSVSKKAENLLYVPATVVVLTSRDFVQRGYQSLAQILQDLPGFDVIRGNGPGYINFYQRGYRSTANDRTLMLVDGVEENDLNSSNIPISRHYAISDIDRIEVIYGPASTMYGVNAFVGVINIITKRHRELEGTGRQLAFNGQARAGSLNTQYIDGTLTAKTPDVALSVTGRYFRSNELDLSRFADWSYAPRTAADYTRFGNLAQRAADLDNALFATIRNTPNWNSGNKSDNWYVRVKAEFKDLMLSYQNWRTDEGAAGWYTNRSVQSSAGNPRWVTQNRAFALTYTKAISDRFQLLNLASYLMHEIDGRTKLTTNRSYFNGQLTLADLQQSRLPTLTPLYYYRISTQFRNELRLFWTPRANIDVVSGVELRSSLVQGQYVNAPTPLPDQVGTIPNPTGQPIGSNNYRAVDVGVYSQMTYRFSNALRAVVGGRVDNNRVRTDEGYGTVANSRLAVVYGKDRYVLKAIYAEAFKDASFLQKYATTSGRQLANPTLLPERVRNLEASASYLFSNELTANLVGYVANYNNAVGTVSVQLEDGTTTQQFQAVGRRQIWGLQAEGSYRTDKLNLWWNLAYTRPLDVDTEQRISDIADYLLNAGGHYQLTPAFGVYLSGNYVGPRRTGEGTSGSRNPIRQFKPFLVLNANLTYNSPVSGLSVQLSAQNLLDNAYYVPGLREADVASGAIRYPQDGRLLSVALLYAYTSRNRDR